MSKVIVPADVHPQQIDFPSGISKRSGALHLRPASTCEMSDAELKWLKAQPRFRVLFSKLIVAKESERAKETLADKLRKRGISDEPEADEIAIDEAEDAASAPPAAPEADKS